MISSVHLRLALLLGASLFAARAQTTPQPAVGGTRDTDQQAANTGAGKTRSPASLLQPDPLDFLLAPLDREQARLNTSEHLVLKASYTFLNQYAVTTSDSRHDEISGRLDFQGVWTFHSHGEGAKKDETSLNLLLRSETNIGQSQQFDLSDHLGSALGIDSLQGGGAERPLLINLLYLKQTWDAQKIALYIGKLHPNQHIGLSPVNNDETSQFLGGPFDGNPAQSSLGAYGSGIALEIGPPNGFYAHGIAIDAASHPWNGPKTLVDGRYYEAAEAGWKKNTQGEGGRDLRVAVYHQNPPGLGSGHGIGFGGDYEFHDHWMPFGRLGFNTRYGSSIKEVETAGLAHVLPFGRKGDMFGAATTITRSSTPGARREQLTELFYRLKVADSLELSPDVEWLRHPTAQTRLEDVVILGARLKVIF